MRANDADKFVALVDWYQKILRLRFAGRSTVIALSPNPVDKQCLDVAFEALQKRILSDDFAPRFPFKQLFRRTRRARVERDRPLSRSAVEEECHVDRDQECIPLRVIAL